jgi:hypothetical protein
MRRGAALVLLAMLAGAGCSSSHPSSLAVSPGAVPAAAGGCPAAITPRALPVWARSGFNPPTQLMPYVLGVRGDIVAIVWADHDALHAPSLANRGNKILWVSRLSQQVPGPLVIRATLNGTGRTVAREVIGGPGPSTVDLPAAGCWTFDLSWSGHHDQLDLRYVA